MYRIKDISNSPRGMKTIRLMNKDNLYEEIRVYEYKGSCFLYCITDYGALHISGSSVGGPAKIKDLRYVFKNLTDKSIKDFKLMKSDRVLYLLEETRLN